MSPKVYAYVSKAINQKVIPENFLNSDDLTSIGNYLVYGETPTLPSFSGTSVVNQELLGVAKKIWNLIVADQKLANAQLVNDANSRPVSGTYNTTVNKNLPVKN